MNRWAARSGIPNSTSGVASIEMRMM